MKILAFGASGSKHSINRQLAYYVADQFKGHEIEKIDLSEFPTPLFSVDLEKDEGYPDNAYKLMDIIKNNELMIISFAEHNSSYTAWFKNIFDWMTRIDSKLFSEKKIFMLSTSTGGRGGLNVMHAATDRMPRHGAEIIGNFSLPLFNENFIPGKGIVNEELNSQLQAIIKEVKEKLK